MTCDGVPVLAGMPTQLLSLAALLVSESALSHASRTAATAASSLRLTDIPPGANLTYHLRQWEGQFQLHWEGTSTAVMTLPSPAVAKAVANALGGGVKGIFRVERVPASSSSSHAAAGGSSSSAAAVAGVDGRGHPPQHQQQQQQMPRRQQQKGGGSARGGGGSSSNSNWQTVQGSSSSHLDPNHAPLGVPDPWADDESGVGGGRAAVGQMVVAEDWEEDLAGKPQLPARPTLQLAQENKWEVLPNQD